MMMINEYKTHFTEKWASQLINYTNLDDKLPDELLPSEITYSDWNRFCHPNRFKKK
jgi:hypothetical protein